METEMDDYFQTTFLVCILNIRMFTFSLFSLQIRKILS